MPVNIKTTAVRIAIASFFLYGLIAMLSSHSPSTCSKRALAAALIAYAISVLALRAVNAIIYSAAEEVDEQINQDQQHTDDADQGVNNVDDRNQE